MKPSKLVLALVAALEMTACASSKPQGTAAMQIEPVYTIRHGVASATAYYQLGRYQQGQGRLAPAEEAYLKAITVDEAYVDAYNALGSLYAERGELKRSAEMFEKVVSLAPAAAYLHNNLGYAYYLQGLQGEAYRSIHKALTLDSGFERAWQNLEKVVATGTDHALMQALRERQILALPASFGGKTQLAQEPLLNVADSERRSEAESVPNAPPETISLVLHQESQLPQNDHATNVPDGVPILASDTRPGLLTRVGVSVREEMPSHNAGVVAVSSRQELSANTPNHTLSGGSQPARQAALDQTPLAAMEVPQARFEVSNGNGISGLARRVRASLRKDGFAVSRVTNYASYAMTSTVVQYQPGFESAARSLVAKYNLNARLVLAAAPRRNVDVRIILGRAGSLQGVVAI